VICHHMRPNLSIERTAFGALRAPTYVDADRKLSQFLV